MSAYRDDLQAARERIHLLEEELQAVRSGRRAMQNVDARKLAARKRVEQIMGMVQSIAVVILGGVAIALIVRVPILGPAAAVAAVILVALWATRRRSLSSNQVGVVVEPRQDGTWQTRLIGPGSNATVPFPATIEVLSLKPMLLEWTVQNVETRDDQSLDVSVLTLVAVGRDTEQQVRVANQLGPLEQPRVVTLIREHVEHAVRQLSAGQTLSSINQETARWMDNIGACAAQPLREMGLDVMIAGVVEFAPARRREASRPGASK